MARFSRSAAQAQQQQGAQHAAQPQQTQPVVASHSSSSSASSSAMRSPVAAAASANAEGRAPSSSSAASSSPRAMAPVSFNVNGTAMTCADRSTLLIDFLHALPSASSGPGAGLQGTKLACGQGGCGACTVNIIDAQGKAMAVNACLKPVGLLDGKNVLTIEGLPPLPSPSSSSSSAAGASKPKSKPNCTSNCLSCPHSRDADCASKVAAAASSSGAAHSCKGSEATSCASTLDPRVTLAQYNGSQCGFCSPGVVMSMLPHVGAGRSERDIEDLFDGHICRCTGYRPILCGMKTYAPSGNAAELAETPPYVMDENAGYGNKAMKHKNVTVVDVPIQPPPPQPFFRSTPAAAGSGASSLGSSPRAPVDVAMHTWYEPSPRSVKEVQAALAQGLYGSNYKLVVGNTSYGVFPQYEWAGVQMLVDISGVAELNSGIQLQPANSQAAPQLDMYRPVERAAAGGKGPGMGAVSMPDPPTLKSFLFIGANTTIQALIDYLSGPNSAAVAAGAGLLARAIVAHLKRVAGRQVRNVGSIAGSLCMSRYWNFPGDTWVVLEGCQSSVQVYLPSEGRMAWMSLAGLREQTGPFLITQIYLPLWSDPPQGAPAYFASARVAQRLQNARPLVNGAFFFRFGAPSDSPALALTAVWGNITRASGTNTGTSGAAGGSDGGSVRGPPTRPGTAHYSLSLSMAQVVFEAWSCGWKGSYTLQSVLAGVKAELTKAAQGTEAEQGSIALRCDIATNLFLKFCINSLGGPATPAERSSLRRTVFDLRTETPSTGSQHFLVNKSEEPVSEPMVKSSALKQTDGKAHYTQSVVPPGCVHATFVTSWAAVGAIQPFPATADALASLASDFNLFNGQDAAVQSINLQNGATWLASGSDASAFESFPTYLLASVEVVYAGQPVAILVGPSERVVNLAAEWLSTEKAGYLRLAPGLQGKPILSVAESKARSQVIVDQNPGLVVSTKLNTVSKAEASVASQTIRSVSRDKDGPNNLTSIDFEPYRNRPDQYVVFSGTHSVPAQVHFYMETQSAVALVETDEPPAYTQMPLAPKSPPPQKLESELDPLTAAFASSSQQAEPASQRRATKKYMTIYASTQSCLTVQGQTQGLLNQCRPESEWTVSLLTPQLGGGFGGKEVQSAFVALGAAFCAAQLHKPVRFVLSRDADMRIIGHRHPMDASFTLAADRTTGRIAAMQMNLEADAGCNYDCTLPVVDLALLTSENAYLIDNFCATIDSYFTNKAPSTAFRTFGVVQSLQMNEYALERLCEHLPALSPFLIRAANFFPYADRAGTFPRTPFGQEVKYANLDGVWQDMDDMMLSMANLPVFDGVREGIKEQGKLGAAQGAMLSDEQVQLRSTAPPQAKPRSALAATGSGFDHVTSLVNAFNATSTYQKLGLSVLPLKYGVSIAAVKFNVGECVIQIDAKGQVVLQCPGVEMGQGLDTKMRQIAALKLTLWSKYITYAPSVQTKYFTAPQPQPADGWIVPGTGASTGSDLNGGAIIVACGLLNAWIAQQLAHTAVWDAFHKQGQRWFVPAEYDSDGTLLRAQSDLWPQAASILASMNLLPRQTAPAFYYSPDLTQVNTEIGKAHVGSPFYYFNYAAAAVLCQIDTLTGEFSILQTDLIYDAGISLNPAIDIGQIEGGFVQGLGYATTEEVAHNREGVLTSINTFMYKPPSTLEIPHRFNVRLYPLLSQIRGWKEEERRHAGEASRAPVFDRVAQAHPRNRLRKGWLRVDARDQVIDPYGVQSSKTTGEPPLVLANAVYFAIRQAVRAAWGQNMYQPGAQSPASTSAAATSAAAAPVDPAPDVLLVSPATTFNIREAIMRGEQRLANRETARDAPRSAPAVAGMAHGAAGGQSGPTMAASSPCLAGGHDATGSVPASLPGRSRHNSWVSVVASDSSSRPVIAGHGQPNAHGSAHGGPPSRRSSHDGEWEWLG